MVDVTILFSVLLCFYIFDKAKIGKSQVFISCQKSFALSTTLSLKIMHDNGNSLYGLIFQFNFQWDKNAKQLLIYWNDFTSWISANVSDVTNEKQINTTGFQANKMGQGRNGRKEENSILFSFHWLQKIGKKPQLRTKLPIPD